MSMSDLPNLDPSYAFQLCRGINMAATNTNGADEDLGIFGAENNDKENTSSITRELQDFTSIMGFHGSTSSCINADDMKNAKSNNIFSLEKAKEIVGKIGGYITQCEIFQQNVAHENGVRYADKGDNIKQSVLNFSAANINAIEEAFQLVQEEQVDNAPHPEWRTDKGKVDGKLTTGEIRSLKHGLRDSAYSKHVQETDLDGDRTSFSVNEDASYTLAADSIYFNEETQKWDYDISRADGLITEEEALLVKNMSNKELQAIAQRIHDEYITNKKAGKKDQVK